MSIALALDLAEKEILHTGAKHSRRVAYISIRLARLLDFSDEEVFDLFSLAVMHDNGLAKAVLNKKLKGETLIFSELEEINEHCSIGEENISKLPLLTDQKNVILYHHERYDGSGFFHKRGDEIPFMAQIIAFADFLDFEFDLLDLSYKNHQNIMEYVKEYSGIKHSKKIADAFLHLSNNSAFWFDMTDLTLIHSIKQYLPHIEIDITLAQLFDITSIFCEIIDSKSTFTLRHSSGLMEKVEHMAGFYRYDDEGTLKLKIAASLHDLGKLVIPNTILDKDGELNDEEFEIIKKHSYFTKFILDEIQGLGEMKKWAYSHHEKLDGSGYPFGKNADELCFEERLMSCLDMYQALTEDRPYRKGFSHEKSMDTLRRSAASHKIDGSIVEDIDRVFK